MSSLKKVKNIRQYLFSGRTTPAYNSDSIMNMPCTSSSFTVAVMQASMCAQSNIILLHDRLTLIDWL